MRQGRRGARGAGGTFARGAAGAVLAAVLAAPVADGVAAAPASAAAPSDLEAALALAGHPERGAEVYEVCAPCHLEDGAGRPDGSFPQLAGQHARVVVEQLVDIREGRRPNPIMRPFAEMLVDPQDLADVAAYLETLPVPAEPGRGPGDHLELGARLYDRDCAGCHGASGEGDAERLVPRLAGQHYRYLLRQIRDLASGRRGNGHPVMREAVRPYTDAELAAVVDYASRLRAPREGSGSPTPAPAGAP